MKGRSVLLLAMAWLCTVTALSQSFTDVWGSAGFDTDEATQGVALGDYDNDGWPDIFTTSLFIDNPIPFLPDLGGPDRCYRNNGGVTFSDRAPALGLDDGGQGQGAAWADYDNDGRLDLYVVRGFQEALAQSHLLYRSTGDGYDSSPSSWVSSAGAGRSVCWADYDNDGFVDVFVTNGLDSTVLLPDARVFLFHNNGDGSFTDVTVAAGMEDRRNGHGCGWSDYDNDGDMDLFVANHGFEDEILGLSDPHPDSLFKNQLAETGSADFVDVAEAAGVTGIGGVLPDTSGGSASYGCCWGDVNNDGDMDLFVTTGFSGIIPFPTPNRLYLNDGDGTFTDATLTLIDLDFEESSSGCTMADFDNDQDLDIYVANTSVFLIAETDNDLMVNSGWPLHILTNEAASAGVEVQEWATACASADFDRDGWVDIYSVNGVPGIELFFEVADNLFHNNGGSNHWLELDLEGTESNRRAIGARVILETGGIFGVTTQTREVAAGMGFQGMDDLRVEFGLGDETSADRVEIRWPSGCVQELVDVAADQILHVIEDCGAAPHEIQRQIWSRPTGDMYPLPFYAPVPPAPPWHDPESVLGDGVTKFYGHSDSALTILMIKFGASVEMSW